MGMCATSCKPVLEPIIAELVKLIGFSPWVGWEVSWFLDEPTYALGEDLPLIDPRYNYQKTVGRPMDILIARPDLVLNLARGIFTAHGW